MSEIIKPDTKLSRRKLVGLGALLPLAACVPEKDAPTSPKHDNSSVDQLGSISDERLLSLMNDLKAAEKSAINMTKDVFDNLAKGGPRARWLENGIPQEDTSKNPASSVHIYSGENSSYREFIENGGASIHVTALGPEVVELDDKSLEKDYGSIVIIVETVLPEEDHQRQVMFNFAITDESLKNFIDHDEMLFGELIHGALPDERKVSLQSISVSAYDEDGKDHHFSIYTSPDGYATTTEFVDGEEEFVDVNNPEYENIIERNIAVVNYETRRAFKIVRS